MTEYAIPPIMLTPTQSTHGFQRRSSIRRGTIASISKDVRVKDFVEIIKKQKALHQQERNTETDSILLKRRHSMMNINKSFIKQQQQPVKGDRILSNNDLKGGTVWQQQQQQQQTKQQQQTDTDKIRLGGNGRRDEEDQTVLYQHLRKCAACLNQNNIECFSSEQEEEEENSPSPSTSSSSNEPWHQGSLHHVEQREQIIKNLNSSMTSYSAKVKELNRCYNGEEEEEEEEEKEYKLKIEQCKKLVAQQELLLNQLYYNHVDIVPKTAPTPPPLEKNTSTFKSIYHDLYKGFKSTTTGITIKQKEDKNEADTIISVQGVCTTIEPSLIPDNLIVSRSPADPSSVYQHNYSLDINHLDRQTKFKLLLQDQWQKDDKVNQCSFHQCNTPFNWFQRKHHCRACGEIYCNTHSGNRLPLFSAKETHHPVFSRVCDTCFYSLAKDSLY